MKISEAEAEIKKAGGNVDVFWRWMEGQTMGINKDGSADVHKYDVKRFIYYKCNPSNEPAVEWD